MAYISIFHFKTTIQIWKKTEKQTIPIIMNDRRDPIRSTTAGTTVAPITAPTNKMPATNDQNNLIDNSDNFMSYRL